MVVLPHDGLDSVRTANLIFNFWQRFKAIWAPRTKKSVTSVPSRSITTATPRNTALPSPPKISAGFRGIHIPAPTSGHTGTTLPSEIHRETIESEKNNASPLYRTFSPRRQALISILFTGSPLSQKRAASFLYLTRVETRRTMPAIPGSRRTENPLDSRAAQTQSGARRSFW